jgi:hypothetical protein
VATSASSSIVVCPLQVLKRGIAFLIHRPSVSKVLLQRLQSSIEPTSHPSSHSITPLQVLKGEIATDPLHPWSYSLVILIASSNPKFVKSFLEIIYRLIFVVPHSLSNPQRRDSLRSMHSSLIQVRKSISSYKSFSSCRPSPSVIDIQDIRPWDPTLVLHSSASLRFFFKPCPSIVLVFTHTP